MIDSQDSKSLDPHSDPRFELLSIAIDPVGVARL